METMTPIVLLIAMVIATTDLLRYAKARDWNGVTTILGAFGVGFVAVWLFSTTRFSDSVFVGPENLGVSIHSLNLGEMIVVGYAIAAGGISTVKIIKGIDNSSKSSSPPFVE